MKPAPVQGEHDQITLPAVEVEHARRRLCPHRRLHTFAIRDGLDGQQGGLERVLGELVGGSAGVDEDLVLARARQAVDQVDPALPRRVPGRDFVARIVLQEEAHRLHVRGGQPEGDDLPGGPVEPVLPEVLAGRERPVHCFADLNRDGRQRVQRGRRRRRWRACDVHGRWLRGYGRERRGRRGCRVLLRRCRDDSKEHKRRGQREHHED
ncbi:MAG: hypothetical protein M5R40_23055 [Anaerolineae bacterium]|nr:hypothetical protein [Anaerolineae bacterium]